MAGLGHPGARRSFREVRRPQQARITVDVGDDLPLVPDVVPGRQDVDAAIVELAAEALGQPKSAGRVFRVDDNEIDRELLPQDRDVLFNGVPAGTAHHIPAKQNDHGRPFLDVGELAVRGGAASAVGMQNLRGPPWQVGAICRSHDSDRDGSQEVGIGLGATAA